ncbi:hypothetical protein [Bradyrhizobium viridifuturi]|uniref:hypothetical protein n=1 Tax=Bradyrhizobium viridifuturi TaxID=1654716 RepID=UPI00067E6E79|nr:hypothetical protein [Bradyrhizobium viridifuturi]
MTGNEHSLSAPATCRLRRRLVFALALLVSIAGHPGKLPAAADEVAPSAAWAVLFEEDPADPVGRKLLGSVVWHTDTIKTAEASDETIVLADIDIPKRFKLALTLKRNVDKALPASHVIELTFVPVPGYIGQRIATVPGVLTKSTEQGHGTPLVGVSARVAENMFMIGLSNGQMDRQRNLQALKERPWFDIAIVDGNQRRAILAVEKGSSGDAAFAMALTAWSQN